jgi:predicted O-linked N-acetylglucosamine transferase (SPINDLY family)
MVQPGNRVMMTVAQAFELAYQHHQAGRLAEAEELYRQILSVQPNHGKALHLLGIAAHQTGRADLAEECIRRAIAIDPYDASAHSNLGEVFRKTGRLDEAIASYQRAIEINPSSVEACYNLGLALASNGRLAEAIASYRHSIELAPNLPEAHNNLGNALAKAGDFWGAIAALRRAIELKADYAEACSNLGGILTKQGRLDEAISAIRQSLELKPQSVEAWNNLGAALKGQGLLDEAIASYRQARQCQPENAQVRSNIILALHFHPRQDTREIQEEQQRWNRQFASGATGRHVSYDNTPIPDRRLRIGYVSADFRDHVVGRNLRPLFHHHDPQSYEIFCYSGVAQPDALTAEFRQRSQEWRSIAGMSDEAVAKLIQEDGIDILVDLGQHTSGNRLPIFARQPAPVQVSFAGYPESTGVETIRYRISDRWLETEIRTRSSEFGVRSSADNARTISELRFSISDHRVFLLDSFWCYDPCGSDVTVSPLPAARNGMVTFSCLNNFAKVNELSLKLWARVLAGVPDSRLLLLCPDGSPRLRILDFLERQGVTASRVEFASQLPRSEYLATYHRLDIVLDTFPYNGHTTSLEALWMGVPVVSLAGQCAVSRAGLSQLTNLGLPELAALSEEDYVRYAIALAADLPRLERLRAGLRSRMENSVLMNGPRFAGQIEAAYRATWRQWCNSETSGQ